MKIPNPFLFLIAAVLAFGTLTPSPARAQVSVSFYYDNLSPYGDWVQTPDYGYVWHPTNVDENWAPYTDGYWAYTDSGWTWVSYEDYGGIVYHYGRWARIPGEGWVWVPGYTWAPAWVSWRTNDSYVGWAPLPPEARWSGGVGFSTWVDARFDIGPGCYSFVGVRDFGAPALGPVIVNREQNVTIINNTTNITNITVNNSNVYTGGPSYSKYAGLSARPIPTLKLVRQSGAPKGGKILSHQNGNQLTVFSPKVNAPTGGKMPPPPKVARTLTNDKPDHGWDGIKDPDQREKMRAQIKDQAGPDTNAPAKPVKPEELKVVGQKGKGAGEPNVAAGETPGPKKGKKEKTPGTTDLLNAPATETPGTSTAGETPMPKKGKKAKTPSEFDGGSGASEATPMPKKNKKEKTPSEFDNGYGSSEATPMPKKNKKEKTPSEFDSGYGTSEATPMPKKSKKEKTPSEFDSGSSDYQAPKHSKDNGNSNLQPFMGGNEPSEPKQKKNSEGNGYPNNYESKPPQGGNAASGQKTPKGKKNKQDQNDLPPGQ